MKDLVLNISRFFSLRVDSLLSSKAQTQTKKQAPARVRADRPARAAPRQARSAVTPAVEKNQWRAVSIAACSSACAAVLDVEGKRFLPGEAPQIPLPGCNSRDCKCTYQHHEDRRDPEHDRRQFESATQTVLYGQVADSGCRRSRRGRRKTD
ncbi:MAG: hypothetical protein ACNA7T_07060 [Haliea sp.]